MLSNILLDQIKNDSIFHSYIFEGSKEKAFEQVELFVKKLFDTERDVNNLIEMITPQNNNISIDRIRTFNKSVFEEPSKFEYNIFVIEDAHFMRLESQNAILKTIEDMPKYSILIMTTDNKFKLLDTIISRSQIVNFKYKYELDFNDDITNKVVNLVQKAVEGNYYIINKEKDLIKELSTYNHKTLHVLTKIFSNIIDKSSYNNVKYNKLLNKLSKLNVKSIEIILFKIEEIKEYLKVNINFQLAIENLIFTIIEEINNTRIIYENK